MQFDQLRQNNPAPRHLAADNVDAPEDIFNIFYYSLTGTVFVLFSYLEFGEDVAHDAHDESTLAENHQPARLLNGTP